jgi:putative ABC transport system permease protein
MNQRPPRLAYRLFDWYCGNAKVDDLRGDMEEVYNRNVEKLGRRKARSIYWRQTVSLIFSYAIRKRKNNSQAHHLSSTNSFAMFFNYFKVGFRNLVRYKYFTLINMAGLAIGMSISILIITLFISVTDYDEFHTNKKNIYRVLTKVPTEGFDYASAPAVLGDKLRDEFPGIKEVIHIDRSLYSDEPRPKKIVSLYGYYTDPAFLSTFTFPLASGDPKTALMDPRSVVLTARSAELVFGKNDPMGQEILIDHRPYKVTGVFKEFPPNTHLSFSAVAAYDGIRKTESDFNKSWASFRNHYVYLHLDDNQDPAALQKYLDNLSSEVYKSNPDFKASFHLQALGDITPGPEMRNDLGPSWSYLSFAIAGGLALLILLPACFNYTNISIARALKRSKEIGLRKTLGGMRSQIFAQFISETVIVSVMALIGACAIFFLIRGEFQAILVHASSLDLSLNAERFCYFLLFAIVTGFVAGILPAIHFSRLNPIEAIKNNLPSRFLSGLKLRKALITFQFALCLTFILGLVIFNKQYRYAMNFDLGFTRENILDVDLQEINSEVLKNEFSKLPFVTDISMSSGVMGHGVGSVWASLAGNPDSVEVYQMFVDHGFIRNMDVKLVGGKTFDEGNTAITQVVINEKLMKTLKFAGPSEAIGEVIQVDSSSLKVVGVVKDFFYWQLYAPPGNFFFRYDPENFRLANVKISSSDMQSSLEEMEHTWTTFSNGTQFNANFLADETAAAFGQYKTLLKMFGFLGILAISVSCLGLLGMIVYTAESKTKEVGIRKVMGASRWNLSYMLSKQFLKLMLIASLFAIPLALLFDKALSGLAYYRVAISFLDVFLALAVMFALGIGTMASQVWKAASTNPADTLKYE